MFCPKCGKKLPDTAMFCGNCGHKLEKSENRKQNSVKTKEPEKKFGRKLVIAVSIAVLGCYVFWLLAYYDLFHFHIRHDWQEATCTEPSICSRCGKTKGEALGHIWEEATCTQPKTCKKCGATEGESLGGHDWEEATCMLPKTCKKCGATEGKSLGHDCADATCMELKTCNRCHMEVSLGRHRMNSSTGICEICGKELRVALDTENWEKYLETAADYGGHGTCISRYMGPLSRYIDYYHFEDAVIEADCEVIESEGRRYDTGAWYSIKDTRRVRLELARDGSGDFAEKIPDKKLTGRWEVKSVSGFVIIDEDEYEKRGITERKE